MVGYSSVHWEKLVLVAIEQFFSPYGVPFEACYFEELATRRKEINAVA